MNYYHLVKVTKKEYAEKLMLGEVYMRPISFFWSILNDDPSINNSCIGDNLEGTCATYVRNDDFATCSIPNIFKSFADSIKLPEKSSLLGFHDLSYGAEKIFCLYSLLYSETEKKFQRPDARLVGFGDTVVIIKDSFEFLSRVATAVFQKFAIRENSFSEQPFWLGWKKINYDIDVNCPHSSLYDEFTKNTDYSWQNEFRIALDLSPHEAVFSEGIGKMSDLAILLGAPSPKKDKWLLEPLPLQIGDIRNICQSISIDQFIDEKQFEIITRDLPSPKAVDNVQSFNRRPKMTAFRPIIKIHE